MKSNIMIIAGLLAGTATFAQTVSEWEGAGAGAGADGRYWGDAANWDANGVPSGTSSAARFNNDFNNSAGQRILLLADASGLDASFTIHDFTGGMNSGGRNYTVNNISGGSGMLTFDTGATGASALSFFAQSSSPAVFNVDMQLNNDLDVRAGSNSTGTTENIISLNGVLSGSGGITTPSNNVYRTAFGANNTYTGDTVVSFGHFVASTGSFGASDTYVSNGAEVTLENNSALNDSFSFILEDGANVNLDYIGTETIVSLTIGSDSLSAGTYDVTTLNNDYGAVFSGTGTLTVIPEPSVYAAILGAGFLAFTYFRRLRS